MAKEKLVRVAQNIYRRGSAWWIQYRVPIHDGASQTRVKQERVPHCSSLGQAKKALALRTAQLFVGQYTEKTARSVTLGEFVPIFLASRDGMPVQKFYRQQLRDRFGAWFSRTLNEIGRDEVLRVYQTRCREAALSTARAEIAALRALYNEAIAQGVCERNPCQKLRLKEPQNARDRVLNEAETKALFDAATKRTDFVRPLFFVLYFTGCRLSEALTLTWDAVALDEGVIRFRDAKSDAPRSVPVTERCASELRRWKTRKKHDTLVFPNPQKSGPLVKVSKSWASLLEEACVQSVTRHDMRHNFVSQLQRAGVNDTVIADLTGHRTLTQLKRYSHSRDEARREAVARLPLAQSLRSQKQPNKPKTGH